MSGLPGKKTIQEHARIYSLTDYLRFIIPSLIGVFIFMVPVPYENGTTVPVAIMAQGLGGALDAYIPITAVIIMGITFLGSCLMKFVKPAFLTNSRFWSHLFDVNTPFFIARTLGFLFGVMAFLQVGPEAVWSENTGGFLLTGLIPVLLTTFLFAGLLLPLLLDFGLLDLCGSLFTKIMRPIFTLPGRSSMDCLASWIGDGTIGVFLTNKQYEDGYYTEREAAVISTTFSVVSITFSLVVIAELGLEHLFLPYYLTVAGTGVVLAIIMPRIPPLSRKKDTYYKNSDVEKETNIPAHTTAFKWGVSKAVAQAQKNQSAASVVKGGIQNVMDMWLAVIPVVMAIGTLSLIVAEYTPFFQWLGAPFVPLLTLMQVPEAAEASVSILVGFADMFLPAILSSGIESEMTRFIIACLSVSQLIYMSEVGGLILGSKLPINFKDLVLVFLIRTIISLPIIVLVAHLLF
jgi:nucleoside recognition membrane protein YjiH